MAPSASLVQRFLWKNRKNGIVEALFQYVHDIVQMQDMAHSICLIKLYQITMRKNFDFFFLTTLKVIAKGSRTSGILDTLAAQEMLTMKTSYISHVLLLELKCVSRDRSM